MELMKIFCFSKTKEYLFILIILKTKGVDSFFNAKLSGAKRVRTADLLTASQALSQLSYSPKN
jgi:hypothetical protein